jgi:hypothetical protein
MTSNTKPKGEYEFIDDLIKIQNLVHALVFLLPHFTCSHETCVLKPYT